MSKMYVILGFSLGLAMLFTASCGKTKTEDEQITEFIAAKGWQMQTTPEGLYYRIDSAGSGGNPTIASNVQVRYRGYFLDGAEFDKNMGLGIDFLLSRVIVGWQLGIPKFKKGGGGKLIIPSSLGYGSSGQGSIPGNTPLVFDINLVNF